MKVPPLPPICGTASMSMRRMAALSARVAALEVAVVRVDETLTVTLRTPEGAEGTAAAGPSRVFVSLEGRGMPPRTLEASTWPVRVPVELPAAGATATVSLRAVGLTPPLELVFVDADAQSRRVLELG